MLRNGYLVQGRDAGRTCDERRHRRRALEATVREYNVGAERGEDPQFGRGTTSFNRYLADPENKPNPCVAPIGNGAILRA